MDVEARTQAIGRELFARTRRAASVAERWTGALFEGSLGNDEARLQLFRFIDVLPALPSDAEVARHLREYFGDRPAPFPRLVRAALALSSRGRLGERVVGAVLRETVRRLARRFIVGATPEEAVRAASAARRRGEGFTLDVLGEACVSEAEATAYHRRYLDLIEALGDHAREWPSDLRIDRAAGGGIPAVNISVKLSALDPYIDPTDSRGSSERIAERLRSILRAAIARNVHIQVDMEERRLKDLTLSIVTGLAQEPEFRAYRALGVVLQAYLRETEPDARQLVEWARRRGTPVTVRLVKGAYWDYETAHARLEGWPIPVYEIKSQTDQSFERLTRFFLENADAIDLAVASHNVRSVAHALAAREALGLPAAQLEFQMLYGMAAPLARALVERGERVRIYMPFGDLIPGMSYLVRRLLENTSNESFLLRGFVRGESADALLAHPGAAVLPPPRPLTPAPLGEAGAPADFRSEPYTDFSLATSRQAFLVALDSVRQQFGSYYPLVIGGERVRTAASLVSVNPSCASEAVGTSAAATVDETDRAVTVAREAFDRWSATPVGERSDILGAAAQRMRERRWEMAAWIVHEAGKPWREADADVSEAIDFLEYYRRQALELLTPRRLGDLPGEINTYAREPRGVTAVLAPWNFPLAILTGMTSAAVAAGNTVVMKPAEQTPVVAAKLMTLLEEAGLPPGVVNYLPGPGEVAGARLVRHPDVALVAFTGSQEVGIRIYAEAARHTPGARRLKRVVAEMGGKNAIIVDEDADLDEAVQGIVTSAFGYAGQKCSACSRVLTVGRAYERVVARVAEAVRTLPMGAADEPGTIVSPLIDAASLDKVAAYIDVGKRLARPALIRDVPAALLARGGYYVAPAVFADVPASCALAREEIFGPVLSLMPARSFDDALRLATEIDYALTGGVFSRSPVHLAAARRTFRVGNLYINRAITGARVGRQPFGGRQLSGVGYQAGGPDYLIQFVESRVVSENTLRRGFTSDELA